MILHLYFARRFLVTFLYVLGIFATISFLIDMVEQLRRFDVQTLGFVEIVRLTLLRLPQVIYLILPLVVMLATIWLFLSLSRSSELVVTRSAGRSALRSLVAPVLVAVAIGVVAVSVMNPVVAVTSQLYEDARAEHREGGRSTLSVSREGLWLRQGSADGQVVIRASRANLDGTRLFDVTFLGTTPEGSPLFRLEADEAVLEEGAWRLRDVKEWRFDSPNPERDATRHVSYLLPSNLTRNQILDSFGTPSAVPIWDLPGFIEQLEAAGFSARQHRVWLQMELAQPLLLASMVLIGAGFTMRHVRFGRTGIMVMASLMTGFFLYFLRNLAQILGETGQVPVLLAAWGPPLAALLLPIGILLHLEDG